MGLFDFLNTDDARMGINLLTAASPSMRPMGFGERLGMAMNMNDEQRRRSEEDKLRQEYRALQMEEIKRNNRIQDDQLKLQQQFMSAVGPLMSPQQVEKTVGYQFNPQEQGGFRFNMDNPKAQDDYLKAADFLLKKQASGKALSEDEAMVLDQIKQRIEPVKQMQQQAPNYDALANLSAQGQILGIKGASGLMELAKYSKPDWQQVDSGGQIQFINKNGQQMPVIGKTMSPDAIASNQVAWANNAISQQNADIARFNAQKPTYHDGALVSPSGEIVKTPMYAPPKGSPEALAQSSSRIIPLLNVASKLIDKSTGSYAGTALDAAAGAVGISTKGAQAAAQLKALEGQIMLSQPRMEGPQSDKDVALYRQMAGQIGDSTVPADTRRAAIEGIRALYEKYSGGQFVQPQSTMSGGGWSATVVK